MFRHLLTFLLLLASLASTAAITTGATAAVCGGKVGKNALSSLGCAVVNTASMQVAHEIGARYKNGSGDMSWLTHKVCHFVLGGTAAEFTGGDFLAGGAGAAVGEMVADAMIQRALERTRAEVRAELDAYHAEHGDLPPLRDAELETQLRFQENLIREREALQDQVERYGRLAAAGTALIGHMDIAGADAATQTAIENNAIPSIDVLIENQGRSLVDQLLAYSRAEVEEDVIEDRLDPEECSQALQKGWTVVTFLNHPADVAQVCGSLAYKLIHGEEISAEEWRDATLTVVPIKKAGQVLAVISKGGKKVLAKLGNAVKQVEKVSQEKDAVKYWHQLNKAERMAYQKKFIDRLKSSGHCKFNLEMQLERA